jgi:hypothetical protein
MNIPVLDLRNVSPSLLVAPLLGRATEVNGPIRALPPTQGQVAVLPAAEDPAWALLLDGASGILLRRQALSQGKELEGQTYFDWKSHDGTLVPGKIVRTTPDGQILELELRHWERLDSIPGSHTRLHPPAATDTISIGTQGNGRKVFRIRAFGGDTAIVVLPHSGTAGRNGPESESALEDSTADEPDDTGIEDSGEVDTLPPAVPATPAAKASKKL